MKTILRVLIAMSVNLIRRKYSRHIDIRRHYIRELCLGNLVKLAPSRTNHMVADALTKSLPAPGLEHHRSVMMGHSDFEVRLCTRSAVANIFLVAQPCVYSTDYFAWGRSIISMIILVRRSFSLRKEKWIFSPLFIRIFFTPYHPRTAEASGIFTTTGRILFYNR
jgi:hypothetical protein